MVESEVLQGGGDLLQEQVFIGQRVGIEQREFDEEQLCLVLACLVNGGGQGVVDGLGQRGGLELGAAGRMS